MKIKKGDTIRLKTEEELINSGWHCHELFDKFYIDKYSHAILCEDVGKIVRVSGIYGDMIYVKDFLSSPVYITAIAEVLNSTLDTYICDLPLEERARYFVYRSEYDWHSTLFGNDARFAFEEDAIQATIEALKQNKEN